MRKIRIKNDIDVRLRVRRNGVSEDLVQKEVTLLLRVGYISLKIIDFSVEGDIISFRYPAESQKHTGTYSITLQVKDGNNFNTVDKCNAFELVPCSCDAGGADDPNIQTVFLEYSADLKTDVGGNASSGGIVGTNDYRKLNNKPSIGDVVLEGNHSLREIGAIPAGGLKTIGGENLEGEGNIPLPDTSGLLSKEEAKNTYQPKGEYVSVSTLSDTLAGYVEKVVGKGLSTNDFTTLLKKKLEGLENYNDTAVINSISTIDRRIDTLMNGSASTAIDTFHEIENFLQGITDTHTLTGILSDLKTQITALIPIKTSQLENDSDYATQQQVIRLIDESIAGISGQIDSIMALVGTDTTDTEGGVL